VPPSPITKEGPVSVTTTIIVSFVVTLFTLINWSQHLVEKAEPKEEE
jgi:hypothetical protein